MNIFTQIASALAIIWYNLRETSRGEFCGDGMLDNDTVHDVTICNHIDSLFPMEDEQKFRTNYVHVIFRVCRHFLNV